MYCVDTIYYIMYIVYMSTRQVVGYPVSVDPGDSAARQRGRRSRGSLQVSCDWLVRGHMTGCSPLIGQYLVR